MTFRAQLPFDFDHRPALSSEDFLVAPCNEEAVAWIDRWPRWLSPALVLYGPAGCGKTHLSKVFQKVSAAAVVTPERLAGEDPHRILEGLRACVLEDADRIVGEEGLEENLLHLYNTAKEMGSSILLTSGRPPSRWSMGLADLRSRLNAAIVAGIGAPDDALIAAVLVKLFADRQLKVGGDVIRFLTPRMERTFAEARSLVERIDKAALSEGRPVTIPLARKVLAGYICARNSHSPPGTID